MITFMEKIIKDNDFDYTKTWKHVTIEEMYIQQQIIFKRTTFYEAFKWKPN
jgi:hypothetical protein